MGYLKNRSQCLKDYRGNLYGDEDHTTSSKVIMACFVAQTVAHRYGSPDDIAEYLLGSGDDVDDVVEDLQRYRSTEEPCRRVRQTAQWDYEEVEREKGSMTSSRYNRLRVDRALDLLEAMLRELFSDMGLEFHDTNVESRREGRTVVDQERIQRDQRQWRCTRRRRIISSTQQ